MSCCTVCLRWSTQLLLLLMDTSRLQKTNLPFIFYFSLKAHPMPQANLQAASRSITLFKMLGRHLASSADKALSVTLCETDPVLLKNMLLFLKEVPAAKAPASLIDIEYIVRQIGEAGTNAMIALCRDNKFNFFFFKDGKGALAYYSDLTFKRPDGMAIDEEMLLYAFQPGDNVQAFIFRDMVTAMEEDSNLLDKDSLYKLLTVGYLKNRRRRDSEISPTTAGNSINRCIRDTEVSAIACKGWYQGLVNPLSRTEASERRTLCRVRGFAGRTIYCNASLYNRT